MDYELKNLSMIMDSDLIILNLKVEETGNDV
jgi:hypothetical protein